MGVRNPRVMKMQWGSYPVIAVEGVRPDRTPMFAAWVGLNSPQGTTVFMQLFQPKNSKNSRAFWYNFLRQTKQLDEYAFLKAMGMELHEGMTCFKTGNAVVTATVEHKKGDDVLYVLVVPENEETTFQLEGVEEDRMPTDWHQNEPCLRIIGTMIGHRGEFGTVISRPVITVLIKEVDAYSFDTDPEKYPERVTLFQKRVQN